MKEILPKLLLPLLLLPILWFTHQSSIPTYNPFDDQFNLSIYKLHEDGCDTIRGECGYWNLVEKTGRLKTHYQFFENDKKVVAKGCEYIIDTLVTADNEAFYYDRICQDSLLSLPIYIPDLNRELSPFGYDFLAREDYEYWNGVVEKQVKILNKEKADTIRLALNAFIPNKSKRKIVRYLSYFTSPD